MTSVTRTASLISLAIASTMLCAQNTHTKSAPATDSAAQASPTAPAPKVAATDSSAQASPIAPPAAPGAAVQAHTAIHVTLAEGIDSGSLKNGQTVRGRLAGDVQFGRGAAIGRIIPAGSPALLSVVGTVPAGKINAVGELSLQLVQIGNQPVDTEILTFRGQPGKRDIADSAPALGTNAGLKSGAPLTFHTQPSPTMEAERHATGDGPGSVNGIAKGEMPAQDKTQNGQDSLGSNRPATQKQSATPQQ